MKFAVDLTKGVLGSNDPVSLWEDITSYIPDAVLLDPNVRILSIACGHCTDKTHYILGSTLKQLVLLKTTDILL